MSKLFNISKIRFFEYGKPAPEGSRFKGILDETSLVGYSRYTEMRRKMIETENSQLYMKEDTLAM